MIQLPIDALRYADLRDANLRGADLRYANLRYADLTGANLSGADLTGAYITGADMTYAMFEAPDGAMFSVQERDMEPTCNCTGGKPSVNGLPSIPHADTCPVRISRAAAVEERRIKRIADESQARAEAEARQIARESECAEHNWDFVSHEEAICLLCGAISFREDE